MIDCETAVKELSMNTEYIISCSVGENLDVIDKSIHRAVSLGHSRIFVHRMLDEQLGKYIAQRIVKTLTDKGYIVRYKRADERWYNFAIYIVKPTLRNKLLSYIDFYIGEVL